ncbi:hypothetical protein LCGC14_2962680, partial [marine sediment metagenome]
CEMCIGGTVLLSGVEHGIDIVLDMALVDLLDIADRKGLDEAPDGVLVMLLGAVGMPADMPKPFLDCDGNRFASTSQAGSQQVGFSLFVLPEIKGVSFLSKTGTSF